MEPSSILYAPDRMAWRAWLSDHYEQANEIWLVFPKKKSGEESLSYNDAVEEALCFGWIDSTIKTLDDNHRIQRFTPRKKGSTYSRANIERLIWLDQQGLLVPKVKAAVTAIITQPYVFPDDILKSIQENRESWENFEKLPASYQRIRIAYIDGARKRPEEFKRRLSHFIQSTKKNKLLGYGGIGKYYK